MKLQLKLQLLEKAVFLEKSTDKFDCHFLLTLQFMDNETVFRVAIAIGYIVIHLTGKSSQQVSG
jgi:hypothetical protein